MPVNDTVGGDIISAWLVKPGVCWIQTRSPYFALRLKRRSDSRLAATGVSGGFLRTFEVPRPLRWARRFIADHQTNETVPNERFSGQEPPTSRRKKKLAQRGGLEIRTQQTGDWNNN